MQWSNSVNAGFSNSAPWRSVANNYLTNNIETTLSDTNSLINHYKKLIQIRNKYAALRKGNVLMLDNNSEEILSFARTFRNKTILINCNLSNNLTYPFLSLLKSPLPEGNYYLLDLFNNNELGTISINSQGGFENLNLFSDGLGPMESSIVLISPDSSSHSPTDNNVIISPNPTASSFSIFLEGEPFQEALVTIFSPEGKMVYESIMQEELLTIDSENWRKGVYIVVFSNQEVEIVKKVVIY